MAIRNVKLATSEGKDLQAVEVNTAKSGYNLGTAPVKLTIYNNGPTSKWATKSTRMRQ